MAETETEASLPGTVTSTPLASNIQIVSPNAGVGPLMFSGLPLETTVGQLKEKIRDALRLHPAGSQQRLIHRGRLLARDSDTLRDIFPEDVLRSGDQQTLHLVLGGPDRTQTPTEPQAAPPQGQSPSPGNAEGLHTAHQGHYFHQRPVGSRTTTPDLPSAAPHDSHAQPVAGQPALQQHRQHVLVNQVMQQHRMQHQQQHQSMQQWVSQLQREAVNRQMLLQQQHREGLAMGLLAPHVAANNGNIADPPGGMDSPTVQTPVHTVVREGVGPNGHYWRMTVNETVTLPATTLGSVPGAGTTGSTRLSPTEAASILNSVTANTVQATQAITNAMHRSTSGTSPTGMANHASPNGPVQPLQPGVTTPLPGTPRHLSRAATPDPSARPASNSGNPATDASQSSAHPPSAAEVYILSGRNGPRGLLLNGSSEIYATPPVARQPPAPQYGHFNQSHHNHQAYYQQAQHTQAYYNQAYNQAHYSQAYFNQAHNNQPSYYYYHPHPPTNPHYYNPARHQVVPAQPAWTTRPPVSQPQVQQRDAQPAEQGEQLHFYQGEQPQSQQPQAQQPQAQPEGHPQFHRGEQPQAQQGGHLQFYRYEQPRAEQGAHVQFQRVEQHAARPALQQVPVRPLPGHPNNPGAVALVAAAWPHIWLIIRLVVFVWWFTSNDPSWSRWATMVAIAIVVFVLNTGMLNGLANQAWDPLRQHLEGLIPLAEPNRPQRAAQPAPLARPAAANGNAHDGAAATASRGPAEPDPARTAARLVAERRNANANWLIDHLRRLERAGILFLASIAPGVAERHIAHLEEQERAERQRREAEEPPAAAANEQENGQEGDPAQQAEGAGDQADEPAPEQAPLIQI